MTPVAPGPLVYPPKTSAAVVVPLPEAPAKLPLAVFKSPISVQEEL